MGYSRNPLTYTEEEQAILLAGVRKAIRIKYKTHAEAIAQRGRFYGLRRAALQAFERREMLKGQGKDVSMYDGRIIEKAADIQRVGISWGNEEKTTLVVGRNQFNEVSQNIMREALAASGECFESIDEQADRESATRAEEMQPFVDAETGEIDMDKYMESKGLGDKTDDAIASAGYTVEGAEEEGNE